MVFWEGQTEKLSVWPSSAWTDSGTLWWDQFITVRHLGPVGQHTLCGSWAAFL